MTRRYELLFVLKPTLVEEELQAKITFLKETLEKNGAEIAALQDMGSKKLAYQVQKFERGHYGVFYFTAPTSSILEVERILRISEDFIKFMTVKYEKQKEIRHWNKLVEKFSPKEEVAKEETAEQPVVEPAQEEKTETTEA